MNEYTENYGNGWSAGQRSDWGMYDEVVASPESPARTDWLDGWEGNMDYNHPQYYKEVE